LVMVLEKAEVLLYDKKDIFSKLGISCTVSNLFANYYFGNI
jgi:hypothetical protein